MISAAQLSIIVGKIMLVSPADSWKVVLAIALFAAVALSASARPPRRAVPTFELRRLVVGASSLYGVGIVSSLTQHTMLAAILYACGIVVSALAAWLSRGIDSRGESRPDEEPADVDPPPSPDRTPPVDWPAFERDLEDYARRRREPVEIN